MISAIYIKLHDITYITIHSMKPYYKSLPCKSLVLHPLATDCSYIATFQRINNLT